MLVFPMWETCRHLPTARAEHFLLKEEKTSNSRNRGLGETAWPTRPGLSASFFLCVCLGMFQHENRSIKTLPRPHDNANNALLWLGLPPR